MASPYGGSTLVGLEGLGVTRVAVFLQVPGNVLLSVHFRKQLSGFVGVYNNAGAVSVRHEVLDPF